MIIDRFDRIITDNGDGFYSVEGILIQSENLESAIATFNAMAPTETASLDNLNDSDFS
jgi:hypothetical protein